MILNPERRLEVDSVLRCDKCGPAFKVWRRQHQSPDGTLLDAHESVLWPSHPDITPPKHPEDIRCRCGGELKRVAP